jgi:hypothetical protein
LEDNPLEGILNMDPQEQGDMEERGTTVELFDLGVIKREEDDAE